MIDRTHAVFAKKPLYPLREIIVGAERNAGRQIGGRCGRFVLQESQQELGKQRLAMLRAETTMVSGLGMDGLKQGDNVFVGIRVEGR